MQQQPEATVPRHAPLREQLGSLPPGLVGPPNFAAPYNTAGYTLNDYPSHGALTFILPYIEQENLFKQFVVYPGTGTVNSPSPGCMVFNTDPIAPYYWPLTGGQPPAKTAPWWYDGNNAALATTQIPILVCPSDDPYASTNTILAFTFGSDLNDNGPGFPDPVNIPMTQNTTWAAELHALRRLQVYSSIRLPNGLWGFFDRSKRK